MEIMNTALAGMQSAQISLEKTATRIAETVSLLDAHNQFQTNARVLQTADEMQKSVINLLA